MVQRDGRSAWPLPVMPRRHGMGKPGTHKPPLAGQAIKQR